MGLSGAFGAAGADFTLASTNPAGLGLYKSSEIMFTPAVHIGSVESTLNGAVNSDSRSNFYVGSTGMVFTSKAKTNPNKPGWRYVTFATGLNRLADYNARYVMSGNNARNSLLDVYVHDANGVNFHDIEDDPYGDYAFDLTWPGGTGLSTLYPEPMIPPPTIHRSPAV